MEYSLGSTTETVVLFDMTLQLQDPYDPYIGSTIPEIEYDMISAQTLTVKFTINQKNSLFEQQFQQTGMEQGSRDVSAFFVFAPGGSDDRAAYYGFNPYDDPSCTGGPSI